MNRTIAGNTNCGYVSVVVTLLPHKQYWIAQRGADGSTTQKSSVGETSPPPMMPMQLCLDLLRCRCGSIHQTRMLNYVFSNTTFATCEDIIWSAGNVCLLCARHDAGGAET